MEDSSVSVVLKKTPYNMQRSVSKVQFIDQLLFYWWRKTGTTYASQMSSFFFGVPQNALRWLVTQAVT